MRVFARLLRRSPLAQCTRKLTPLPSNFEPESDAGWTNSEFMRHRCAVFSEAFESARTQKGRIEKIDVLLTDPIVGSTSFSYSSKQSNAAQEEADKNTVHLRMNRGLSTPYDCALHVNSFLAERSALALVNGEPWDMHRPLEGSGQLGLEFVHFKESDKWRAEAVNKAYLRSCTLVLGFVLETSFKPEYFVKLCSFPPINIRAACFLYDAQLNLGAKRWSPRSEELRCMSVGAYKIRDKSLRFEPLEVSASVAKEMFRGNDLKVRQIDAMMSSRHRDHDKLTVYRVGDFVDICQGPCIADTGMIGRFELAAIHEIDTKSYGRLSRVQALSIPSQLHLHYWTFEWLLKRAGVSSPAQLPSINVN